MKPVFANNVIFWPSTRPKNAIPRWYTGRKWHIPMASNRKRSRGWIKAYDMGQGEGPIVPLTVMHRKRVTSELHDSYFRLMTIKHPISKIQWVIVWALNYYIIELSSGCKSSCQQTSRQLETRLGRESHTRPRRPSESRDGVDPNIKRTRKTQRDGHNSGVKIWSLCSVSSTLSHANLEQPFRTLAIKREVNVVKEIFLLRSFLRHYHASFYYCVVMML